jgi:uncharacterized membrane protein YhdT
MFKKSVAVFRRNKAYYLTAFAVCAAVFAYFYALNRLTGLHDDDYHFKFVFLDFNPTPFDRRVESLGDIFLSIKNYYFISGGRVTAHFLSYLMLFIGKPFFNVVNALMFVLLGLLILFNTRGKSERRSLPGVALLVVIYVLLWLLIPAMGETVFWVSGATNYLWMACLSLAFLLRYVNYYRGESRLRENAATTVAMFIFGVFAGITNENSGGAVLYVLFLYFLMYKQDKRHIPKWAYSGVAGLVSGIIFLLTAPGNMHRAANIEQGKLVNFFNSIYKLYYVFAVLREGPVYLVILVGIIISVIILKSRGAKEAKSVINISLAYLVGGLLSMFVLLLTPEYSDRPYFFGIVLLIVSFVFAADRFMMSEVRSETKGKPKPAAIVAGAASLIAVSFCVSSMHAAYKEYVIMDKFNKYEYACFESAKKRGETEVTIDRIMYYESDRNINYTVKNVTPDANAYINLWLARYYGFEKVLCWREIYSPAELGIE